MNIDDQPVLLCNLCTRQLIIDLESSDGWAQDPDTDTDYCPPCATVLLKEVKL